MAALRGFHRRQGQPAALLRPGHWRGVGYRRSLPHHAQAVPRHGGGERRAVSAARQQHPGLHPGLAVGEGTGRDRPGQRRAAAPPAAAQRHGHRQEDSPAGREQGQVGALLVLLRRARRARPARAVRHHVVPDGQLRLQRHPVPEGLRGYRCGHRHRPDDRPGGTGPDLGHVPHPEGLRQEERRARPVRQPVHGAVPRPGQCLRGPVLHRGTARRGGVLRHGPGGQPAGGRRGQLQPG